VDIYVFEPNKKFINHKEEPAYGYAELSASYYQHGAFARKAQQHDYFTPYVSQKATSTLPTQKKLTYSNYLFVRALMNPKRYENFM
jgi:hypothetical protein